MKIESVITIVNKACSESRFIRAREVINKEWHRLTEYKNYDQLNHDAKEFIKIIKKEREAGSFDLLSITDKQILNLFNQYVRETQIKFAKRIYEDHYELFEKTEARSWLHSDAKFFCDVWKRFKEE